MKPWSQSVFPASNAPRRSHLSGSLSVTAKSSGWFIATAIAGCVAGDAFPVGFRRSGRGILPLVSGLAVALPTAGLVTGSEHIPVAVARHPETVPPVAGSYLGPPEPRPTLSVYVRVLPI